MLSGLMVAESIVCAARVEQALLDHKLRLLQQKQDAEIKAGIRVSDLYGSTFINRYYNTPSLPKVKPLEFICAYCRTPRAVKDHNCRNCAGIETL